MWVHDESNPPFVKDKLHVLNLVHSIGEVIYDADGIHDNVGVLNLIKLCQEENIRRPRKIYAKCGAINKVGEAFDQIFVKNGMSWNAGYQAMLKMVLGKKH